MKPILEDLQKAYAGRAEIVVVDMDRYPAVTERVGIDAMPTQVFYDSRGVEIDRHQGFMPREDIVAKLAEMGAE
jgi:thioredoxin 1